MKQNQPHDSVNESQVDFGRRQIYLGKKFGSISKSEIMCRFSLAHYYAFVNEPNSITFEIHSRHVTVAIEKNRSQESHFHHSSLCGFVVPLIGSST